MANLAQRRMKACAAQRADKTFIARVTLMQEINGEGYEDYANGDSFNPGAYAGDELTAYQSGWDRACKHRTV